LKSDTLIIQNASADGVWYDLTLNGQKPHPTSVDLQVADDFGNIFHLPARSQTLDLQEPFVIPPVGIFHLIWTKP
jgi:hypothetical protein